MLKKLWEGKTGGNEVLQMNMSSSGEWEFGIPPEREAHEPRCHAWCYQPALGWWGGQDSQADWLRAGHRLKGSNDGESTTDCLVLSDRSIFKAKELITYQLLTN
jgi:hypothetical protein